MRGARDIQTHGILVRNPLTEDAEDALSYRGRTRNRDNAQALKHSSSQRPYPVVVALLVAVALQLYRAAGCTFQLLESVRENSWAMSAASQRRFLVAGADYRRCFNSRIYGGSNTRHTAYTLGAWKQCTKCSERRLCLHTFTCTDGSP